MLQETLKQLEKKCKIIQFNYVYVIELVFRTARKTTLTKFD